MLPPSSQQSASTPNFTIDRPQDHRLGGSTGFKRAPSSSSRTLQTVYLTWLVGEMVLVDLRDGHTLSGILDEVDQDGGVILGQVVDVTGLDAANDLNFRNRKDQHSSEEDAYDTELCILHGAMIRAVRLGANADHVAKSRVATAQAKRKLASNRRLIGSGGQDELAEARKRMEESLQDS